MRVWQIGAAMVLAACVAGCGGNSTPVGVTVTPTGTAASPQTVVISGQQPFIATVTGTSTSTVNWFICLPPTNTDGYESNTGKLRAANRLWNDKLDRALRGAADAAPQRFCGCSAEYGEYEYIRAKLCFSWNWSAGFH